MELRAFLIVLVRRWWVFVPTLLITYFSVFALTFSQTPVYQARATFVVTPGAVFANDKEYVSGLEILSRRIEIGTTYAEVAMSRRIRTLAAEALNLTREQRSGLSVTSRLIAGTNIVEVRAEGTDPTLVRDYANAVGTQLVTYAGNLYETYVLTPLDEATQPGTPIKPNTLANLLSGLFVGLALAIGLVVLAEYVQVPRVDTATTGITDYETGAYNKKYFLLRLQQEISRARRNGYSLCVALINADHRGQLNEAPARVRREALQKLVVLFEMELRDEDVMAYCGGTIFAFLFTDVRGDMAKEIIERWRTRSSFNLLRLERTDVDVDVRIAAGIAVYQGNSVEHTELLDQAEHALHKAQTSTYSKVCLFDESETKVIA